MQTENHCRISKTALITGGSSGLGFEIAKYLAAKKYHPIIVARQKEKISKAVAAIKSEGVDATGFQGDITNDKNLEDIAKEIELQFKKIDFLILNAGVVHPKLLTDNDDIAKMGEDLNINLWGTILSYYIFVPLLKPNSKILIVSSGFGLTGAAGYSVYCSAKAGLINFAESLRRELLCKKISVHVACPGDIDTPLYQKECKDMPKWMKDPWRGTVMSSDKAAKKILKKCFKKRFLIIIGWDVWLLFLVGRLLPEKVKNYILDNVFPMPD